MRNEELIELISTSRLTEAVQRLRTEKTRLTNVSASHPIFDVLNSYVALKATGYSYYAYRFGHDSLTPEQKEAREGELLLVIDAMLDANMDPHMELSKSDSWSNDQEARSKIGLASNREKYPTYEFSKNSLYSRFAGLGWTAAMDLLLKRGVVQNDKRLTNAVLNTCRSQRQESLHFLLERHPSLPAPHSYECAKIMSSVMNWSGVDPVCVDKLYSNYGSEGSFDWVKSREERADDRTSIEWLTLAPGKWGQLHRALKQEDAERSSQKAWMPALFPALFKQYVRTGDFKDLLQEALADTSFELNKARSPFIDGVPLASWVLQGGTFHFPGSNRSSWETSEPEKVPASVDRKAQLRRCVRLYRALTAQQAPTRTSQYPSLMEANSEAMDWSSKGWTPTRAFIHRHPQFLAVNMEGSSPVHSANTVETALAWETLGASSQPNKEGVDPWVLGMQTSDAPAPWAREIAQRLKTGRLDLYALGKDAEPLSSIVTRSPPLARAWIKKSRKPLSPAMLAGAIKNDQWPLVCEWLKAGMIDSDPSCRILVCNALTKPPGYRATDTMKKGWSEMADALLQRPNLPWEEQMSTWRACVGAGWPNNRGTVEDMPLKGMKALSQWGPNPRENWGKEDFRFISALINNTSSHWMEVSPIQLTPEEAVDLTWEVLLDVSQSQASRYGTARTLLKSMDSGLPLRNAGPQAFERLRQVNEEAPYGSTFGESKDFEKFLEAEELSAFTPTVSPSRSNLGPGRRL